MEVHWALEIARCQGAGDGIVTFDLRPSIPAATTQGRDSNSRLGRKKKRQFDRVFYRKLSSPPCVFRMDLNSLKDTVAGLTLYDLKAGVRKVQNGSPPPWSPSTGHNLLR